MNQECIRKIFKKYDVDFKGRKYLQKQLINKKVNQKNIRNFICQQDEEVSSIFCLIKGSVQVFFALTHEIKQKIPQIEDQKDKNYKNPKFQQQKIIFSTFEGLFQAINDEAIIAFLQNEEKRNLKRSKQKTDQNKDLSDNLSDISQSSNNQIQNLQRKKIRKVKSLYSAIVTSSECEYIELTFQQAKALLKERIQYIQSKQKERQKMIKQSRHLFQIRTYQSLKQSRIEQIAMTNMISKFNYPKALNYQLSPRYGTDNVIQSKQGSLLNKNNFQFNDNQFKKKKSISLLNLNNNERKSQKKDQFLPLLNNFNNQLDNFNQNQLILQRYRSRKAFQKFSPSNHLSQYQKSQKLLNSAQKTESLPKQSHQNQERIFKQNLKKIIKKKLNFQKIYGQTIKQFADASKPKNNNLHSEQNQNKKNKTSIQKSYSMDKLKMIEIKRSNKFNGPKLNSLLQQNQQKQKIINKYKISIDSNNNKTPAKQSEIKNSLNRAFQQPINQFMQLQRMKKKFQQQSLFLRLQNLDNYFDKVE